MAIPFRYDDDDLRQGAKALMDAREENGFDTPSALKAATANAEADVEAVLDAVGGSWVEGEKAVS